MVRAVLFDWDGTLAETRPAVVDAMEHTLAAYGREPWDETKRKYRDTSKSLKENFPNFFGEESVRAYDDYLAYYRVHGMRRIVPAPGAADFLRSCINAGVGIYVVSNKEKTLLTAEVRHFFPDIVFNAVLGNGDAPRNKPAPDPVFAALKMRILPSTAKLSGWSAIPSRILTAPLPPVFCLLLSATENLWARGNWRNMPPPER